MAARGVTLTVVPALVAFANAVLTVGAASIAGAVGTVSC